MLGPYINSKGTRGTNISANADLITVETLFVIYGLNVLFCGYLRGPGGFNYLTLPILLSGYSLIHMNVHVQIRKQSENNFLVPIQNIYFQMRGAWWGLTQDYQIFRTVRPHHIEDKYITRDKNNQEFFIYGPQCENNTFWDIRGGGGGGGGGYDWAHLASQLSSHLNQSTCKIWLSYKSRNLFFVWYLNREPYKLTSDSVNDLACLFHTCISGRVY